MVFYICNVLFRFLGEYDSESLDRKALRDDKEKAKKPQKKFMKSSTSLFGLVEILKNFRSEKALRLVIFTHKGETLKNVDGIPLKLKINVCHVLEFLSRNCEI